MKEKKKRNTKLPEVEKKKNPLHREYGIWSNSIYVLRQFYLYKPKSFWLILIGVFCSPLMNYLWNFISKYVIDLITNEGDIRALFLTMLIFTVIQVLATTLNTVYNNRIWPNFIGARMRLLTIRSHKSMTVKFEHLEDSDVMNCYEKADEAVGGNNNGIEGLMRSLCNFFCTFSSVIVGMLIIGTLDYRLILIMLVISGIGFFVTNQVNRFCKKNVWDPLAPLWRKLYYMKNTIADFKAAKDIRLYNLKDWMVNKHKELNKTRYKAQKLNEKMWLFASFISATLWGGMQLLLYAWLIRAVVKQDLTIGNFTLYLATAGTFFQYISMLLNQISNLLARSREVDDFRSFMDFDKDEAPDDGIDVPHYDHYEFVFKNVSFRYPKSEKYALKNMNLTLNSGERLAVVGLNGAGKSTFIKLLLRLYEPTEGEILLNGVNIKSYNRSSYYSIFAPVFQDVQLFAFPLAENVSMKRPEDTDKEKAKKALIDAGFENKLNTLEKGIDTEILKVIFDDGVDLSGGEKQKLALARALYKDAPVAVLDEPTAALDALAETQLYKDFDKLIGGKTSVYVSHRLSSTRFCNNVAMFQDGELIEYGTHDTLMEQNGAYANMFHLQAQYYVETAEGEVTANA